MGLAEWAERGEALLVYGKLVESAPCSLARLCSRA
jgi:hypothetical protein